MRAVAWFIGLGILVMAGQAGAAALTVTKTPSLVSDPVDGTVLPKVLPGAIVGYDVLVKNPNVATVAKNVVISDDISDLASQGAEYYVGTGDNPVTFSDGNVLGLGLFSSGLAYTYTSLSSTTDSVDFSSDHGVTWTYVPHPDVDGYDPLVTNIRVSPSGNFAALSGFNLHLKVRIRK